MGRPEYKPLGIRNEHDDGKIPPSLLWPQPFPDTAPVTPCYGGYCSLFGQEQGTGRNGDYNTLILRHNSKHHGGPHLPKSLFWGPKNVFLHQNRDYQGITGYIRQTVVPSGPPETGPRRLANPAAKRRKQVDAIDGLVAQTHPKPPVTAAALSSRDELRDCVAEREGFEPSIRF